MPTFPSSLPLRSNTKENPGKQPKETGQNRQQVPTLPLHSPNSWFDEALGYSLETTIIILIFYFWGDTKYGSLL